jgi:hypothetical protein
MRRLFFILIESLLIIVASGGATLAFFGSWAYTPLRNYIGSHWAIGAIYLPLLILALLSLFGFFNIVIRGKGPGSFTWLTVFFSLPSILSFDSINVLSIFHVDFHLTTSLSFTEVFGIGVLIIVTYLTLNSMRILDQNRRDLQKREADAEDIDNIDNKSYISLLLVTIISLIAMDTVALLAFNLESLVKTKLITLQWDIAVLGLSCLVIIAAYIYWVGSRRKRNY